MAKKTCIILATNMYIAPYLAKYTALLTNFDIIYWNRDNVTEECQLANKEYVYNHPLSASIPRYKKLESFIKYKFYVEKILKENNYDRLIILVTNLAIILSDLLLTKYKNRYVVDIRDYFMENNPLIYFIEKEVIAKAKAVVISSEGYKNFLPKHNYYVAHNDQKICDSIVRNNRVQVDRKELTMSFIGVIRYFEQDKKTILRFANKQQFKLRYIGKDAMKLRDFIDSHKITNVELIGNFPQEEAIKYYEQTDLILNLYGNHDPNLDYALSNKLYFAAKLGKPILVCPETYMEKIVSLYNIGFTCNLEDENIADKLLAYYKNIEWNDFYSGCDKFLKTVKKDNEKFEKMLKEEICI